MHDTLSKARDTNQEFAAKHISLYSHLYLFLLKLQTNALSSLVMLRLESMFFELFALKLQ